MRRLELIGGQDRARRRRNMGFAGLRVTSENERERAGQQEQAKRRFHERAEAYFELLQLQLRRRFAMLPA
jgi:hypothetical protein